MPKRLGSATAAIVNIVPPIGRNGTEFDGEDTRSYSQKIKEYDTKGPGVLGYYLDFRADLVRLIPHRVAKWTGAGYEWADDSKAGQMLHSLHSPSGEGQQQIFRAAARLLAGQSQAVLLTGVGGDSNAVQILPVSTAVLVDKDSGLRAWPLTAAAGKDRRVTAVSANNSKDWVVAQPVRQSVLDEAIPLFRVILDPDSDYPNQPSQSLERAIVDLERFARAEAAIHSGTTSALVQSGLLWFQGSAKDMEQDRNGNFTQPLGRMVGQIVELAKTRVAPGTSGKPTGAMAVPVTMETAPQFVKSGVVIDPGLFTAREAAIDSLAMGLNVPKSIITDGPGAAQRLLNEWLQDKSTRETSVLPLAGLVADGLTMGWLRPALAQAGEGDAELYSIRPDLSGFDTEPPSFDDLVKGVEVGAIDPADIATKLEMNPIERPAGMTPWDHFLFLSGKDVKEEVKGSAVASGGSWWTDDQ